MANSTRLKWAIPNERANPWYDAFVSLVNQQDATGYASREDRQILLAGGGQICWNTSSGLLTWDEDIILTAGIAGFRWILPAGSINLVDGAHLIVDLTRYPASNKTLTSIVSQKVPNSDTHIVIAGRVGTEVFFRNGFALLDGQCSSFASPNPILSIEVVPVPKVVEGTFPILVGHIHLLSGEYYLRCMLGAMNIADTATLKVRAESDASIIATISPGPSVLQEIVTPLSVPASGQYYCTLEADALTAIAVCTEIKIEL